MKDVVTAVCVFVVIILAISGIRFAIADPPIPALNLPCRITNVYDGDTVTVEVRIPVRVRLLSCWAPELRKPGGIVSRDHLRSLAEDKKALLHIPIGKAKTVGSLFSFDRVLAHIWIEGDDKSLSTKMVEAGHATVER